ncbi:daunorubicin/doxorubicin resistance ABC transporter ATP-binding protein DrrA, partial [Jiangella rhizosphaerae]
HAVGAVEVAGPAVAVPVAGAGAVTAFCAALAAAGLTPEDVAVRRPTLDDVFVHVNTAEGQVR